MNGISSIAFSLLNHKPDADFTATIKYTSYYYYKVYQIILLNNMFTCYIPNVSWKYNLKGLTHLSSNFR